MTDLEKVRMQIEAILEENGIENYVVIITDGEMTFSTHSVNTDQIINIVGFMESLKLDFLQAFKDAQTEVAEVDEE